LRSRKGKPELLRYRNLILSREVGASQWRIRLFVLAHAAADDGRLAPQSGSRNRVSRSPGVDQAGRQIGLYEEAENWTLLWMLMRASGLRPDRTTTSPLFPYPFDLASADGSGAVKALSESVDRCLSMRVDILWPENCPRMKLFDSYR